MTTAQKATMFTALVLSSTFLITTGLDKNTINTFLQRTIINTTTATILQTATPCNLEKYNHTAWKPEEYNHNPAGDDGCDFTALTPAYNLSGLKPYLIIMTCTNV